jgi:hypothetical protein
MESNTRSAAVLAQLDELAPAELLTVGPEVVRQVAGMALEHGSDAVHVQGRTTEDRALVDSVVALHRLETRVHAEKLRRIAEVERRDAYRGLAVTSTGLWTDRLGVSRTEARTLVGSALVLGRMPGLAARHAEGTVGAGHVADTARTVAQLDRFADDSATTSDGDGGHAHSDTGGHGQERRAELVAALDRLVAGQADADSGADAGASAGEGGRPVARQALRRRLDEFTRRRAPELLAERELRLWANRNLRLTVDQRDPDRTPQLLADLAPITFAKARAMIHALARHHSADDPRSFAQRCHDAFDRILDLAAVTGELPDIAGDQPRVLLLVEAGTLHDVDDAPAAQLDGYGPVSADTARQTCCDAEVTAVARGDGDKILNVGRDRRTPNRAQRRGTFARDGGCIGCGAPLAHCQIHHIRPWARGGRTDIDDLVAVCWDCHALIHHCGWQVIRQPGGRYTLRPPHPVTSPRPGRPPGPASRARPGGENPQVRPPDRPGKRKHPGGPREPERIPG